MNSSTEQLKEARLLKECSDAYVYAVEVNEKTESSWAIESSIELCKQCAQESLQIRNNSKIYDLCLEYVGLCENIRNTQSGRWRNQDANKEREFKSVKGMSK
ncbi:hypothetical protein GCM10010954_20710 [Halobacillus andaensis]|uniref:Uncharacterized protein n=1 Tax=Halobacillus andaensis TaxID=1176239 RepID=A0A917B4U5_HALAA|nr:hypothetical protein [Halobacillus andaensis]MBP2004422.1 hypothetical protein [Halobacillus andaensis]GGF21748.1 hypothetical protein GCM10010954_20710 [Halobacillus andaensis]